MLHGVIMAGGSGTRFWPLSRRHTPKQFLNLGRDRSLIQSVFDRCQPDIPGERFWVITNSRLAALTREHLPQIAESHIIAEPVGRNTAPCIGLAAMLLMAEDPDATMLVMPADHMIQNQAGFLNSVQIAEQVVQSDPGQLVLFGIRPSSPETNFGYIEVAGPTSGPVCSVVGFREKPDLETARSFVNSGRYLWNSGIFLWKAQAILEAIRKHAPQIAFFLEDLQNDLGTDRWNRTLDRVFPQMPSLSIDYAVLEHASNISVVEATFDWDDVGSWEAMSRLHAPDEFGNITVGPAVLMNSRNCLVHTEGNQLVTVLGMNDCLIVHTPEATFVANRSDQNAIRELVQRLEELGHDRVL